MIEIRGIGVSGKKTSGIAYKIERKQTSYHDIRKIDTEHEKQRFLVILQKAKEEIEDLYQKALEIDPESALIFTSHVLLLEDVEMMKYMDNLLGQGYDLLSALIRMKEDLKSNFLNMQSEIFRSKVDDVEDIFDRLARLESGEKSESDFPQIPFILVCDDILPSLIYRIPEGILKGIITRFGSNCSHGVILARTKNIPVIIRTKNRIDQIKNEDQLVMNGESGAIFILDK
ncbi:MAG: hypothetical protein JXB08_04145 [Bacilli bacterium]|nr:hypothetical protein [Bacilli bacterium]MBN2877121.1 hypothetical protein [Bacilli bacterium]